MPRRSRIAVRRRSAGAAADRATGLLGGHRGQSVDAQDRAPQHPGGERRQARASRARRWIAGHDDVARAPAAGPGGDGLPGCQRDVCRRQRVAWLRRLRRAFPGRPLVSDTRPSGTAFRAGRSDDPAARFCPADLRTGRASLEPAGMAEDLCRGRLPPRARRRSRRGSGSSTSSLCSRRATRNDGSRRLSRSRAAATLGG